MLMDAVFFYSFALLTIGGAILTITRNNAVHSALSLIGSLIGVAGLFLLQKAEFLFAAQILLYIGGVTVLFLFVIMLVNLDEEAKFRQFSGQWVLALVAVLGVALLAVGGFARYWQQPTTRTEWAIAAKAPVATEGNTERIADVLFSEYLVPFEAASLLLIVAVIGAVLLARKREALDASEIPTEVRGEEV
ncbi:MAG: NADH-quinone oxidoreductase subunit J [Bryobacterales bacterium]|nr:NADH-quinone oxidoreductase subunit J [Bryobacterales bacterium]